MAMQVMKVDSDRVRWRCDLLNVTILKKLPEMCSKISGTAMVGLN